MEAEHLEVAGLTGVDLDLPIAGPGSRSYAFIIDWHIRLLLALAWLAAGWILLRVLGLGLKRDTGGPTSPLALAFWLPPVLIYGLYHPVLEVLMRGRTPGKRMAGVRIVTRQGARPSTAALLIRNVFRLLDGLPFMYLTGLVSCVVTRDRVRIGDLAAGTVLVLEDADAVRTLERIATAAPAGLDPRVAELVHELLERWGSLVPAQRLSLGRTALRRVGGIDPATVDAFSETELRQRLVLVLRPVA